MLQLTISGGELYDESTNEFIEAKAHTIQLEHSLVSLSKWESKWHKPFLHSDKTEEEILDYIEHMTLTENVDPNIFKFLTQDHITAINNYISDPMTATKFPEDRKKTRKREIVTAELIYYWMLANEIPFECQHWHLNRLITLIRLCGVKNAPPDKKKRSQKDLAAYYAAENQRRKAKFKTKG